MRDPGHAPGPPANSTPPALPGPRNGALDATGFSAAPGRVNALRNRLF
ncbi:hypothetical protein [Actinacidiphila acidipaludis]|uniref:Uncharacterized protein n=1 Tax=Actinacidiphila acidipaludis TaxID=2873382 RepID=A0ABS7Q7X1_9ACTN|nr:hypothetical protein [Streptomyces acidipaludis]MBY8879048.1 hypothetical protein [Streptomyces acidipaludis]